MLRRKALRSLAYKINMRTLAQDLPCRAHRVTQMLDASHSTCAKRAAVHNESVQLHSSILVQKAAASCVEGLIVFHDDDSFFDSVQRRAAAAQHVPPRGQRIAHTIKVRVDHVIGHSPSAAVYD